MFGLLQFMKFIKKIGDGDVTVKDNEVVENKASALEDTETREREIKDADLADLWAKEFHANPNKKVEILSNIIFLL